jgi:hypothetical protein
MELTQRFGNRLNTRHLVLVVVIWWLAMLIVYSIITLRVNHLKDALKETGVEITHEFSNLVSLPLLERNSQSEKVAMWEGGFASHAKILNFVSDVTYAGTKIGEIFIGLSTPETIQTRKQFLFIAVLSCLILLFLVAVSRYQTIKTFLLKYLNLNPSSAASDPAIQKTPIICPLCGAHQPISGKLFNRSGLDQFLKNGDSENISNAGGDVGSKRPHLPELPGKEDLSRIRRQIISRCTEIIKKLTAR